MIDSYPDHHLRLNRPANRCGYLCCLQTAFARGVLGIQAGDTEYFIFDVNYDIKVLQVRAERGKDATCYIVNPAFWPAFSIAP